MTVKEENMVINKVKTEKLFRINGAGERRLNVYRGCSAGCPFCYWQSDETWLGQITAYVDVVDRLRDEIKNVPKHSKIKFGYCALLDRELKLTRDCLKILVDNDMDIMLSIPNDDDIVLRDMDIITAPGANVKVLMELTRFDLAKEFNETGKHMAFDLANTVRRNGVNICTTISPVLPGITDVERMAAALLPDIPVHISMLDIRPGTIWGRKTLEYIAEHYKELLPVYEKIAETGVDPYYESLKEKYDGTGQIRAYLPFLDRVPEA